MREVQKVWKSPFRTSLPTLFPVFELRALAKWRNGELEPRTRLTNNFSTANISRLRRCLHRQLQPPDEVDLAPQLLTAILQKKTHFQIF